MDQRLKMTQAYTDESEGKEILLMSSCILPADKWMAFTDDWQSVLDEPPKLKAFHMREARALDKHFAGWTAVQRDLKIIRLTEVIRRHDPEIVTCWINKKDHIEALRGKTPFDMRHVYFTCFNAMVVTLAQYIAIVMKADATSDFVFDEKSDVGYEALLWYPAAKDALPPAIQKIMPNSPVFKNDEDVLPLQSADLVAWHKRRQKETPGDPELEASRRIDGLAGGERFITKESMEQSAKKMIDVPGFQQSLQGPSVYQQLKRAFRKEQRREKSGQRKEQ